MNKKLLDAIISKLDAIISKLDSRNKMNLDPLSLSKELSIEFTDVLVGLNKLIDLKVIAITRIKGSQQLTLIDTMYRKKGIK